ncbi:MAG: alpha/beta hydrolase-fold protein [Chloroflexota bacterium]
MPTFPLLALARTTGNPVIEGGTATFLWQGKSPVLLLDDLHNWEDAPQPLTRIAPGIWSLTLQLPPDAYLEYAYLDPKTGQRVEDPLNPNKVWNGISAWNYYFYMPRGGPTELAKPVRGAKRGTVSRHEVPTRERAAGSKRTVHLYQPPVRYPVPLVVVYDGVDYLKRAKLNLLVDNLIALKRVRPFAMALVQNGGAARVLEYSCADATLDFVFDQVIPLAQENLTLTPPGGEPYGVLGASMGGLMALYTGLRLPHIFGKVLSQSGAFFVPELHSVIADLVRCLPRTTIQVWMDVGKFDFLLAGNREMHALLQERKYYVTYREYSGGHNYTAWRDDVWRGLEKLYR